VVHNISFECIGNFGGNLVVMNTGECGQILLCSILDWNSYWLCLDRCWCLLFIFYITHAVVIVAEMASHVLLLGRQYEMVLLKQQSIMNKAMCSRRKCLISMAQRNRWLLSTSVLLSASICTIILWR